MLNALIKIYMKSLEEKRSREQLIKDSERINLQADLLE